MTFRFMSTDLVPTLNQNDKKSSYSKCLIFEWRPLRDYTAYNIHIENIYLTIRNYYRMLLEVVSLWAHAQIQIKTNSDKAIHISVPKRCRPKDKIKFLILRIKKDLFIQNITSGNCCLHQSYRILKTKLKSKMDVCGGHYEGRKGS